MKRLIAILLVAMMLVGCGSTPRARTATSTVLGTAGGAAIGSLSGQAWQGAVIGGSVAGLASVLWDEYRNGSFDSPDPKVPASPGTSSAELQTTSQDVATDSQHQSR
jgi:hypothetical protein